MAFKKVYSEVPACSQGHTSNDTLACVSCGMMHVGSHMKLYVPEDQPVPVASEASSNKIELGQEVTVKVTYDAEIEKEKLQVIVGHGLEVVSTEAAAEVATVKVTAKEPIFGHRTVIVDYMGVRRMFMLDLVPATVDGVGISEIKVEPAVAEAGKEAVVTVTLTEKAVEAKA